MCISGTKNYNKTNLDVHFCFYLRCVRVPKGGWNPWAFSILWSLLFEQHVPKEERFPDATYSAWMYSRTTCSWLGGSSNPERGLGAVLWGLLIWHRDSSRLQLQLQACYSSSFIFLLLSFPLSMLQPISSFSPSYHPSSICFSLPEKSLERRGEKELMLLLTVCRCQRLPKDSGDLHLESVSLIRNI